MKRNKPLRRASNKRQAENKIYLKLRAEFLRDNPYCMCDDRHKATEVHHTHGRGKFFLDEMTWMAICQSCHRWIHNNPSRARENGWLK